MELDDITGSIVDASVRIHRDPGPRLLESLYEALLARELRRRGLHVDRQRLIQVSYDGIDIEDAFRADLLVEESVIVEVKSVERLAPVHGRQLLTYLRLTDLRVGLLLNFGAARMKDGIRRRVLRASPCRNLRALRVKFRRIDLKMCEPLIGLHREARSTAASLANPHPRRAPGMPRVPDGRHGFHEIDVAQVMPHTITVDLEEAKYDADYVDELGLATHVARHVAGSPSSGCGRRA